MKSFWRVGRTVSLCLLVFALVVCSGLLSRDVRAADTDAGCGEGLTWSIASGRLTIEGIGAMTDWASAEEVPWHDRVGEIQKLWIGYGVTHVGDYAFAGITGVTSVELPVNLSTIGDYAFYGCSSLASVKLPRYYAPAGANTFTGCAETLKFTGNCCGESENVEWELTRSGVLTLDRGMYMDDYDYGEENYRPAPWYGMREIITSVTVGSANYKIGAYAFYDCANLTSVTLYNDLRYIYAGAFQGCSSLTSITIPGSVTQIGADAFTGCDALTLSGGFEGPEGSFTWTLCAGRLLVNGSGAMPDWATYGSPFTLYRTAITSAELNAGITSVGANAFYNCELLTSVTLPAGLTSVRNGAFYNCKALSACVLPDTVTSVGTEAFCKCTSLGSMSFRADAVIGECVLGGCSGLTSVTLPANLTALPTQCLNGCSALTSLTIPAGVTSLGNSCLSGCSALAELEIPSGVTVIGQSAFNGCTSLKTLAIPAGVTSIGERAFYGCRFDSFTVPKTINWSGIEEYAFSNCSPSVSFKIVQTEESDLVFLTQGLSGCVFGTGPIPDCEFRGGVWYSGGNNQMEEIVIDPGVTGIGSYAFYYLRKVTHVTIPDTVTSIGASAFAYCDALESVTFSDSVTSMASGVFQGTEYQVQLYDLGDGVYALNNNGAMSVYGSGAIPDYTYSGNQPWQAKRTFTSLTIGEGVTGVGKNAFAWCAALESAALPSTVTSIGESAFDHCTALTSVTLPANLESIGERAFDQDGALTGVTLPSKLERIGKYAFQSCASLGSIEIPASVTTIGSYAFSNACLTALTLPGEESWFETLESNLDSSRMPFQNCSVDVYWGWLNDRNLFWTLNGGALVVKGSGEMISFTESGAPWCIRDISSLTIDPRFTSIGNYAFEWLYPLEELTLPAGIRTIGEGAFCGSETLTSVTLPEGLTSIGAHAFEDCAALTSVTVPSTLTVVGADAFAGSGVTIDAGTVPGSSLCWSYSNGELSVNGVGIMPNYTTGTGAAPWAAYSGLATSVTVGSGVTKIGNYAFYSFGAVRSVTVPGSVKTVGDHAFESCTLLESVTLQQGVKEIGTNAFAFNRALTQVSLPTSLDEIGKNGFAQCTALTSITLPERPYIVFEQTFTIGEQAFSGCASLASVNIPEDTTVIGMRAFKNTALTSVTIPAALAILPQECFQGCSSLQSVSFAPREYGIAYGYRTFKDCTALTSFTVEAGSTLWEDTFSGCTGLTTLVLENGLKWIPEGAFSGCTGLTSVTLSNTLENVPKSAFAGCTSLTSVTIPGSVDMVCETAFQGCTALRSVTFEEGVGVIGKKAFDGCTGITALYFPTSLHAVNPDAFTIDGLPTVFGNLWFSDDSSGVYWNFNGSLLQIYGEGAMPDLVPGSESIQRSGWLGYAAEIVEVSISEDITTIGAHAFDGCDQADFAIPAGVTSIGDYAFRGSGLSELTLPDTTVSVGSYAFSRCADLTSVSLPMSITSYGDGIFDDSSLVKADGGALTETLWWNFNGSLLQIYGTGAMPDFEYDEDEAWQPYLADAVTDVIIGSGVTSIGANAFAGGSEITSVSIPASVTGIGAYAFKDCTNLTAVTLPALLNSLGNGAFFGCGVTQITIPSGVTAIPNSAFEGCGLQSVSLPAGVTSIGACAFSSTDLTSVDLTNVSSLGENAFSYSALESVTIPGSITTVPEEAFEHCAGLRSVVLSEGVTTLGRNAFSYCPLLTSVTIPESLYIEDLRAFASGTDALDLDAGECGVGALASDCCYVLHNGVLYVNGTGAMPDFDQSENRPYWYSHRASVTSVRIAEGVTHVGSYAFTDLTNLAEVKLPANGVSFGTTPFLGSAHVYDGGSCGVNDALRWDYADGALTVSGTGAMTDFAYGESRPWEGYVSTITSVTIGSGVTSVGGASFANAADLTSVSLPETVTSVGSYAFFKCGFSQITLPVSLTTIGSYAFANSGLRQIDLTYVTLLGKCAFQSAKLRSVTIPGSITTVPQEAFTTCDYLESVVLSKGVTTLEKKAFYYCTRLKSVTIPESLMLTDAGAFGECYNLNISAGPCGSGEIPDCCWILYDGVLYINGTGAMPDYGESNRPPWYGQRASVSSVRIAEGVTHIGAYAFADLTNLADVKLPANGATVGSGAFAGTGITSDGGSVGENFRWEFFGNTLVLTGSGAMPNWDQLENVYAPWDGYRYDIERVVIGTGISSVGDWAFTNCANLTEVSLPASVTSIGLEAFANCGSLTAITFPANLTQIGDAAFYGCRSLADAALPTGLTSLGSDAFANTALTGVTIPAGVTEIKYQTFQFCASLASVSLPSTLTKIGNGAFAVTALTDVSIPAGVTEIGYGAFSGCASLTGVTIPANVTEIEGQCFINCTGLETVTIPGGVTEIRSDAFSGCTGLVSIELPASVTEIGMGAFNGCAALTTVNYAGSLGLKERMNVLALNDPIKNAEWVCAGASYTVVFSANCSDFTGEAESLTCYEDVEAILTENPFTRAGYTFAGWNTAADGSGTAYEDGAEVLKLTTVNGAEITLYAQWAANSYAVKFNANGGKGTMADLACVCGEGKVLPANAFSRTGYGFSGWNTAANGSGTSYANRAEVLDLSDENGAEITLFAQWTANTYTVKFNANGGTGTMANLACVYGERKNLPANTFTKNGGVFNGWTTKADGSGTKYGDRAAVQNLTAAANGSVTLYASWKMTGWASENGKWYYYDPATGVRQLNWTQVSGKWYYLGSDGVMRSGWQQLSGVWYYLGTDGAMRTGWQTVNGVKYYFDANGAMQVSWKQVGGVWYYFGTNGHMQTGWAQIGGKWYYLGTDGAMQTGWKQINAKWYYLGTDGAMRTGWQTVNGVKYYLGTDGAMRTGMQTVDGKKYYFGTSGALTTTAGWQSVNGSWYYRGTDGAMVTGWKQIGGKWYYMDPSTAIMSTNWKQVAGKWYYLGTDGAMRTGWQKIGTVWYFFGTSGVMQTGWYKENGNWYYFKTSGAMACNESLAVGGKTYRFNTSGVCLNP